MSNHFAYLLSDADQDFFGGVAKDSVDHDIELEKRAASVGQLVATMGKPTLKAATKLPRAAVKRPVVRQAMKMAAELELLKIAGSRLGDFGMTKAAVDMLVSGADEVTDEQFAKLADVILGAAVENDIGVLRDELVKEGGLTEDQFQEWAIEMLKTAGVFSTIGKAFSAEGPLATLGRLGRGARSQAGALGAGLKGVAQAPLSPVRTFSAGRQASLAASKGAELAKTRAAIPALGARAAEMPLGGPRAALAGRIERLQRIEPKLTSQVAQHENVAKRLSGHVEGHPAATPVPPPAPKAPAPEAKAPAKPDVGAPVAKGGDEAGAAARKGEAEVAKNKEPLYTEKDVEESSKETGKKSGMMDSINKLFKGETLSPEERAHVIKAGLGAYAIDRYALHGGRES